MGTLLEQNLNEHGPPRSTGCDSRAAGSFGRAGGQGMEKTKGARAAVFLRARELREQLENSGLKRSKLENPSYDAALQSTPNKQEGACLQRSEIRLSLAVSLLSIAFAALRRPGGEPPGRGRLARRGESGGGEGDSGLV